MRRDVPRMNPAKPKASDATLSQNGQLAQFALSPPIKVTPELVSRHGMPLKKWEAKRKEEWKEE